MRTSSAAGRRRRRARTPMAQSGRLFRFRLGGFALCFGQLEISLTLARVLALRKRSLRSRTPIYPCTRSRLRTSPSPRPPRSPPGALSRTGQPPRRRAHSPRLFCWSSSMQLLDTVSSVRTAEVYVGERSADAAAHDWRELLRTYFSQELIWQGKNGRPGRPLCAPSPTARYLSPATSSGTCRDPRAIAASVHRTSCPAGSMSR